MIKLIIYFFKPGISMLQEKAQKNKSTTTTKPSKDKTKNKQETERKVFVIHDTWRINLFNMQRVHTDPYGEN